MWAAPLGRALVAGGVVVVFFRGRKERSAVGGGWRTDLHIHRIVGGAVLRANNVAVRGVENSKMCGVGSDQASGGRRRCPYLRLVDVVGCYGILLEATHAL